MKPLLNWELADINNDSLWSVVELPWEYENGFRTYACPEVKYHLENNGIELIQVEKLIIIRNRITGDTYGFRMRVLPDLLYINRHGNNLHTNSYLNRDEDLSGFVLFYSISDEFVNGWRYSEGKVIARLELFNPTNEEAFKSPSLAKSSWVYTLVENCTYNRIEYKGMVSIVKQGCSSQFFSELVMDFGPIADTYGPGGYDPGGGPSNPAVKPQAVDPCAYLKSLRNDADLAELIEKYMPLTKDNVEHGFIRAHGEKETVKHKSSTRTNIRFEYSSGTKYTEKLHTHPNVSGGTPFPSANDIRDLYSLYKNGRMHNVSTFRYVIVSELGVSCIMISDVKAFEAFGEKWNLTKDHLSLQDLFDRNKMYMNAQSLNDHLRDLLKLLNGTSSGLTYLQSDSSGQDWNVKQLDSKSNVLNVNCN